jgi:hypothetical protein
VRCPEFGPKAEKVPQLPSKAPFRKRFEEAAGQACESVAERRVAKQFVWAESTVRGIDGRYLERWAARRQPELRPLAVDEIHIAKAQKFLTVVRNLETGEPQWFGRERKKETVDAFSQGELRARQRRGIGIVYDNFHIMRRDNDAIDEVRRAEFFRKGGRMRGVVKGKRWLLLSRWLT